MEKPLISLDSIEFFGHDLRRPECVLCTADGSVYTSNWDGGITHILPSGEQNNYIARGIDTELKTNGFAIQKDGSFLIANLGDEIGGIWHLERSGACSPYLLEVDGEEIPPSNFVHIDRRDRIWVSISTRLKPRARGYRKDVADGFIAVIDKNGARIVADGLGYTNEVSVSPDGNWLYANETFARKLSRFPLSCDGKLGEKEVFTEFGFGTFPDGLCFDSANNAWITSIISNRIIKIAPDGSQTLVIEDADHDNLLLVEKAFDINRLDRPHLDQIKSSKLKSISSLAFGGRNCDVAYVGCLLDNRIMRFNPHAVGARPYHWDLPE